MSEAGHDDSIDLEAEFEAQQAAERAAADEGSPDDSELDEAILAALQALKGRPHR
jgi:hypothetical protein